MNENQIEEFKESHPSLESYWRSIVLFGRNVATYKLALAESLLQAAKDGKDKLSPTELAFLYSFNMCRHLEQAPKQTTSSHPGDFINACLEYNSHLIPRDELITRTARSGFNVVLDAFPVVNRKEVPVKFYVADKKHNVTLTDNTFRLLETPYAENLPLEAESRWNLVETAWDMGVSTNLLNVRYDGADSQLYMDGKLRRKNITSARDALNGYQKGKCFYCFDDISVDPDDADLCDVDHFFPHALQAYVPKVNLDGVWNLVLSCRRCNRGPGGKSARVPAIRYLERLSKRNEFLISSHHPLRETIIRQTGATPEARHRFLQQMDNLATNVLIHRWETEQVGPEVF